MHDATIDHIRLNTLYIRKDNDRWSLVVKRKVPLTAKTKDSYTKLVPAICEYWWRPWDQRRPGRVACKCLGCPPFISGEFFRFGTSLALHAWSVTFMTGWCGNTETLGGRNPADRKKTPREDMDPQDWVLDVVHDLDEKWFRRINFISQTTALTSWMYGNYSKEGPSCHHSLDVCMRRSC